jgi:integrase/recombinase XerD
MLKQMSNYVRKIKFMEKTMHLLLPNNFTIAIHLRSKTMKSILSFLENLDISALSKETYRKQLKCFFVWILRHRISRPQLKDIINFKNYLLYERMIMASTATLYLITLKKYFQWLEIKGLYKNVTKGIKLPKFNKRNLRDSLTKEQSLSLLNSITTKRNCAMINLMLRTGLRVVEVVRININDVKRRGQTYILYIQGKGRHLKDEYVVLTPNVFKPIEKYIISKNLHQDTKIDEPLFTSESSKNFGKRLTTRSVSRIVKIHLKRIGINSHRLTAHSLRHTSITLGLLGGATPQEMMMLARHKDLNTTLIYSHNIERLRGIPEKKIDAYLES